jgi:hypothetical protein
MADGPVLPGTINRAYYYATPFDGADAAAIKVEIAAGGVRFDDILSDGKRSDSRQTAKLKEAGREFELTVVGGRVVGFNCKITARPGHTVYDALDAAYAANTVIGILLCTGDKATAGTRCFVMNSQIEEWSQERPDPGATMHDFTVSPTAMTGFTPATVAIS